MSFSITPAVAFPGAGGPVSGNGYVVCATTRTYGPVCTKCDPVWQPDDGERFETHAAAKDLLREHDEEHHR